MSKHRDQIIGTIAFRYEGDGCLSTKYQLRDDVNGPFPKGCKLIGGGNPDDPYDPFIGRFRTTWLETTSNEVAILSIERDRRNASQYRLRWIDLVNNVTYFEGTGMLFNGNLVCAYWN